MTQENFKNHPISIASLAVVGTIAIGILLYKEVILPTHTLSLKNEISALKSEVNKLNAKVSSLVKVEVKNKALLNRLALQEKGNLFSVGNPYPIGLEQVRIGDSLSKVSDVYTLASYPNAIVKIQKESSYVTVSNAHAFFEYITYYIDEKNTKLPITHISFNASPINELPKGFLQEKIIAAFGYPDSNPKGEYYSWDSNFKTTIYKIDNDGYTLISEGYRLGFWPE
ncbi:MAG: hypothetical protein RPU60_02615 [Candidatus Sedimenticola sp. (ex Thyasira tokunagai)]